MIITPLVAIAGAGIGMYQLGRARRILTEAKERQSAALKANADASEALLAANMALENARALHEEWAR